MNDPLIDELVDVAFACADAAASVSLDYFRTEKLIVDNKLDQDFDPVTQADRQAEQEIRKVLATRRDDDGIIGEEFGVKTGASGLQWILDPIDGTRAFISGTPTWGTLISVEDENGPLIGLIDQPYIGERFVGTPGSARLLRNGQTRRLRVSTIKRLEDATIFTTFPEVGTEQEGAAFHALAAQTKLTRYGMDCYAYALLAAGQIDLVVEAGLQIYDIHAPATLIEAAGGIVTDWHGRPANRGGRSLAAATPELHEAALKYLHGVD